MEVTPIREADASPITPSKPIRKRSTSPRKVSKKSGTFRPFRDFFETLGRRAQEDFFETFSRFSARKASRLL